MATQYYTPDGGSTWLTAEQMQARGLPLNAPQQSQPVQQSTQNAPPVTYNTSLPPGSNPSPDSYRTVGDGQVLQNTRTGEQVPNPNFVQQGYVYLKDQAGNLTPYKNAQAVDYQMALKSGFTPVNGQGQPTTQTAQTSSTGQNTASSGSSSGSMGGQGSSNLPQNITDLFNKLGIDPSTLNPSQLSTLSMMGGAILINSANDKTIAPPSLSQADLANYVSQAHSLLDPQFADQFKAYSADFANNISQLTGELPSQEQQQALAFKQQKDTLQNQMAETGLAQSGIRRDAEAQLKTQQQGVVQSNRRQLQNQINSLGLQAEKLYGAQGASLLPSVTSQAFAPQGLQSQTFNYSPVGLQYPTQTAANALEVGQQAQNLESQALNNLQTVNKSNTLTSSNQFTPPIA